MTKAEMNILEGKLSDAKAGMRKQSKLSSSLSVEKGIYEERQQSFMAQERNLEERLKQVQKIIDLFNKKISDDIEKTNAAAFTMNERFAASIKCSDMPPVDLNQAFKVKKVDSESNTSGAYNSCVKEKARLEQGISDLKVSINKAKSQVDALDREIAKCVRLYSDFRTDAIRYHRMIELYKG